MFFFIGKNNLYDNNVPYINTSHISWFMERYAVVKQKKFRKKNVLESVCVCIFFWFSYDFIQLNGKQFSLEMRNESRDSLPIKSKIISHVCFEAQHSFKKFCFFSFLPAPSAQSGWIRTCCLCKLPSIRFTLIPFDCKRFSRGFLFYVYIFHFSFPHSNQLNSTSVIVWIHTKNQSFFFSNPCINWPIAINHNSVVAFCSGNSSMFFSVIGLWSIRIEICQNMGVWGQIIIIISYYVQFNRSIYQK